MISDDTTATTDTTGTVGGGNSTDAVITPSETSEPVCSTCGYPLHVKSSGPTGTVTDQGITWRLNLMCTNSNYNGTGQPCPQNGQVQQTSDSVIPILGE